MDLEIKNSKHNKMSNDHRRCVCIKQSDTLKLDYLFAEIACDFVALLRAQLLGFGYLLFYTKYQTERAIAI